MTRRFIIQQILDTWINQLPIDSQTGTLIATKEDIARLSEQIVSLLRETDESQTRHWFSILVELYAQAKFSKRPSFYSSNNP